jgi:CRP/FNR family transcriptional regulator, cyclic AMP receptor protein
VGAARETVNRQLQEWRRQGILKMGRNRISLPKMNKLSIEARRE